MYIHEAHLLEYARIHNARVIMVHGAPPGRLFARSFEGLSTAWGVYEDVVVGTKQVCFSVTIQRLTERVVRCSMLQQAISETLATKELWRRE